MTNRKSLFKLGSGILLSSSLLLAACGGNNDAGNKDNGGDASKGGSGEKVEVTFWHAMNGPHQEAITELTKQFNDSQKEITVKEMNQGDYSSLQQSIMASGRSGDLPTMAQLTPGLAPDLSDNGLLQSLDDLFIDESGFTQEEADDIYEGFIEGGKYNGKMWTVPFSKSTRVMFYNKGVLDEYGVDVPESWEDVIKLGEKMVEKDDDRVAMGLENGIEMEYETIARQAGSPFITKDPLKAEIDSPESVEALTFMMDAIDKGYARTAGEDGYFSGPFGRGESALYIGSSAGVSHVAPTADENNLDWGTAEIPTYNGEKLTLFAGNDLGLFTSATEEEQKAAMTFIHFLLEPENTAYWAMETGYVPIRRSAMDVEDYKKFVEENPTVQAANKELEYGMSSPVFKGYGEYRNVLLETMDDVLINKTDEKEALTGLNEKTQEIMDNNN